MEGLYLNLDNTQKDEIKKQYDSLKHEMLKLREYAKNDDIFPKRDCFMRDYARILYSPSFRRLQGKMQILGIQSSAFYRNRLTHSLEVSQIAISIARLLADSCDRKSDMYSDDLFVLEAAALAHDIGHPAFGHKGERVLNEVSKTINFEGNGLNDNIQCPLFLINDIFRLLHYFRHDLPVFMAKLPVDRRFCHDLPVFLAKLLVDRRFRQVLPVFMAKLSFDPECS